MNIAMLASEALPLSKTGGLADVVYALSKELAKDPKNEVIIFTPNYRNAKINAFPRLKDLGEIAVDLSWRHLHAHLWEAKLGRLRYILIGNSYYFDRPSLYGYHDDCERFAFFGNACLAALRFLKFAPDILHVHDWQVGMVPCLLKEKDEYKNDPLFAHTKTVLTIHNPAFKGFIDRYFLADFWGLPDSLYDNGQVRFDNMVSTLKAGIVYADKITTVSPTHRNELLSPYSDQHLNGVLELRKDDFQGILNGIDEEEWNPAHDAYLAKTYTAKTWKEGKETNQQQLLSTFSLTKGKGPIYAMVSRLSWQKGVDLLLEAAPQFVGPNVEGTILILGSGEYALERRVQALRDAYPSRVGVYLGYQNALSHLIYAGADFFLMPSLFEPCGISQMIAQRYGTLPIVRYTGGLRDTVEGYDGDPNQYADGIGFRDYDLGGLTYGMSKANELYHQPEEYARIVGNALRKDNSWKKSAAAYLRLYHEALGKEE
jgi:starch synthase